MTYNGRNPHIAATQHLPRMTAGRACLELGLVRELPPDFPTAWRILLANTPQRHNRDLQLHTPCQECGARRGVACRGTRPVEYHRPRNDTLRPQPA